MEKDLSKYIGKKKGVLTIVEILKRTPNNKYTEVKCVCSRCGQYSTVRLDRITIQAPYAEKYCSKCKESYLLETRSKELIGKTNGVLTCISVDGYISEGTKYKRLMVSCKCSVCGKISSVRAERILSNTYTPVSCEHCYRELVGNATHSRYYISSGANSEEEYRLQQETATSLSKFKSGARSRNLEWNITDEEAIRMFYSNCHYCNKTYSMGIDRVDSKRGYTSDNVVPCCGVCNVMKNKFSQQEFLSKIKLIYENLSLGGSTTISKESTSQANGDGNGGHPEKDGDIV